MFSEIPITFRKFYFTAATAGQTSELVPAVSKPAPAPAPAPRPAELVKSAPRADHGAGGLRGGFHS